MGRLERAMDVWLRKQGFFLHDEALGDSASMQFGSDELIALCRAMQTRALLDAAEAWGPGGTGHPADHTPYTFLVARAENEGNDV